MQALSQLGTHTKLIEELAEWKQEKLNSSLQIACKLGSHRLAIPLIKAGAYNFEECIQNSGRMNHILAFLRLCQAALEDDQTAIDLLLCWNEDSVSSDSRYPSLMQYNHILMPLIENGTLSVAVPIRVALKYQHTQAAARLLAKTAKNPQPRMINWHHLELESIEPDWLAQYDHSMLSFISLSFNSLKQIPEEILAFNNLSKLQMVSNQLVSVPAELFCLSAIENIDLSHNMITLLPETLTDEVSDSLRVLKLANNQLTSLPDYFTHSRLAELDLSSNRFQAVSKSIFGIRNLESLDISHNGEIKHVSYELGGLRHLQALSVENINNATNIPDRQRGSVLKFIQDRFKSMQTVTHYEIQVVGSPKHNKALEGVMNILVTSDLKCNILKFASPAQFLFLHEVFLLPNVLYVVPWDYHNKQEANDLHLVLRHLSVHCPNSPVIVVACWKSILYAHSELAVENQIAESLWKDLGDRIHLHHVLLEGGESAVETGGKTSVQMFLDATNKAAERIKITTFVPCSYYECNKVLKVESERMQEEDRSLFMSEWDFWELVRSMPSHDLSSHFELPELVRFLCSMATIVHLHSSKEAETYYVLSRQWYCHVLGNVITQNSLLLASLASAIVRQEGLVDLLGSSSIQLPIPTALQYVLNRNAISLALSSERWLLPSVLSPQPDVIFNNFSSDDLRRQYTCTLVPITLMGRLITHLLINMESLIKHISHASSGSDSLHKAVDWRYWKNGIVCWMNACNLVYSIEILDINAVSFHQGVEIRVANTKFGHITMHVLGFILDSLLKNWYPAVWKTVEVWVPCSYCIHINKPQVPSISFHDCLNALSKGVGVKCVQHLEKIVNIAKIVPDLIQEDVNADLFIPPTSVSFDPNDKATCLSAAPMETIFKGYYNKNLIAVKPYPSPVPNAVGKDSSLVKSTPILEMWTEFEVFLHMQSAECPFLVSMIGICPQPLCLVFPFAKWSSLEEVISLKEISVPRLVRLRMLYQLAKALEALHSYHVIHRNVSLANILVYSLSADDDVNVKLAGLSDASYGVFQGIGVGCYGTYPAPEMLQVSGNEYDERVDIFAYGFVAYEIITRSTVHVRSNTPFQKKSSSLTVSDRPSLNPVRNRAPYLCDLLAKCWNPDAFKRPYANKIVDCLRAPIHTLVQDGNLINENHEFYAAAAKFTRVKNSFHTDVFICSGQLTGQSTAFLTHLSLPNFEINRTVQLPSEFVICMGCVGSHLWVSFHSKKMRVYSSSGKLKLIDEFSFDQHVVVIGVSPTSVYLGLVNGMLQIYDVTETTIPTEPRHSRMICPGEEFKNIELLDAYVMCATRNAVYRLHPDTLYQEAKIEINARAEIRSIVISEPGYDDEDQPDTAWVSFRRTDQVQVLNSWTGKLLYKISCAAIVSMDPNKVWVYSLRVVLDTIWIGLNTGHILIFAAVAATPRLISHLHVHCSHIRQLLLLNPSYMGNMTVLSAIDSLRANHSLTDTLSTGRSLSPTVPDSVLVLSMGTGLNEDIPNVQHSIQEGSSSSVRTSGLYAVVMEGMVESRLRAVEEMSDREPIAYMTDSDGDHIYSVPPLDDSYEEEMAVTRADTWSASVAESPIQSHIHILPRHELPALSTISENSNEEQAPPLPPRPGDLSSPSDTALSPSTGQKVKRKFFHFSKKKKEPPPPPTNKQNALLRSNTHPVTTKDAPMQLTGENSTEESFEDSSEYDYPFVGIFRSQSLKPQPHTPMRDTRSHTLATPNSQLEDSGKHKGYDPYVTMEAVQLSLAQMDTPKDTIQTAKEVSESDFQTREEFWGKNRPSLVLAKPRCVRARAYKEKRACNSPRAKTLWAEE